MAERLQKLIAASGYTSRRKAEQLILDGKVSVNGEVVKELGVKAEPSDIIIVEGVRLLKENKRYYLFYKPEKVITSMSDEKDRVCVKDFFEAVNERVVPVGRLDYDTSGALIMSNDGEFINLITHPKHKIKKTYVAKINGKLEEHHLKILRSGVRIDNYKTSPAEVNIVKNKNKSGNTLVRLTIHEGNAISVSDNGRGIPVDFHEKEQKSALEVVMTKIGAGGKFDKDSYKVSGGLHGVGVSCVNALSTDMTTKVYRDGKIYQQKYQKGKAVTPVEVVGESDRRGG